MTDRSLPEWMSKNPVPAKDVHKQVDSGFYKKNVIEGDLPYLEFTGTIIYSHEKNDCSFLSEDLRSGLASGSAVGFDIEWPPSFTKGQQKKVALVQLCVSEKRCYLFHLSSMTGFPTGLKLFLEDESIRKVGVGITGDMWKLLSDFEIKLKNFVELGDMANERLRCVEKWSLDGLVKHLFRRSLFKQDTVRCSKWDDLHLSEDQKRYAATDAYAGLIVHNKLHSMNSGAVSSRIGLMDKLSQMRAEIEELAASIPEEVNDFQRAAKIVEDMAANLDSLKDVLTKSSIATSSSLQEPLCPDTANSTAVSSDTADMKDGIHEYKDLNHFKVPEPVENGNTSDVKRECIMSLDISEYELQMLEMQARQEDLEEQSTLEFQEQNVQEKWSDQLESDNELESQMLQYVTEVEKLSHEEKKGKQDEQKESEETSPCPEEEEEDMEEEELDSSLPEPKTDQITCLKMYFGHSRFKPVQWKVIHSVLKERRDNLVVMATGYGKSLCFQFPPVYCGNLSIVISPLIALMEDQVLQLQMSNIPACFLGSAQTKNVLSDLKRGHYKVVYITPEYCSGNVSLLEQLNTTIGISLIAVDEAHCISKWGHDFRGAYRNLGTLKRRMPDVPIVALTATASPSIREDIVKSLNLQEPIITLTSFDRPNLFLEVKRKSGNMEQDMKSFLRKKTGGDYEFEGAAIVYCPSRKEAERMTSALYKLGIKAGLYHAGLGIKQRRENQQSFMRDEIQCIVATVAFGMGINKPDIRKVIHYGAPKEMEAYYQELGRAGRDGLPSACHVLWAPGDMVLNRFLINQATKNDFRGYRLKMMAKMEQYLSSHKCRRKLILSHFEDKQLRKVTSGIMGTDQCCDNCKSGSENRLSLDDSVIGGAGRRQEFGPLAYQLLGAVEALGEKFGVTAPILFLRGSTSQRLPGKFRVHPLFGGGKSVSEACWKALARELLMEEYLQEYTGYNKFCTLCRITPKGKRWLSQALDERERSLLLQPSRELSTWAAPRHNHNPASSSTSSAGRPSSTFIQNLTASYSRQDRSKPYQKSDISAGRSPAKFLTQVQMSKPQPPPVSPRELELQTELYAKLVAERQKMASEKNIPPAILATNKILLDMAKTRPCNESSLKQVDGVSEAKSRMLAPLLITIASFCEVHQLKVECSAPAESTGPLLRARPACLPDSIDITYRLFQEQGKSMKQVCDARTLPTAVVESHLLQAFRADHPLDTERAGLTATIRATVTNIIQSPPINSNLSDIKAIRARTPEDISNFLLQLTVAMLQREGMPTAPPSGSSSLQLPRPAKPPHQPPQQIAWIEPEDTPVRRVKAPVHPAHPAHPAPQMNADPGQMDQSEDDLFLNADPGQMDQSEDDLFLNADPGQMDQSEDDLFLDIPMPEETGPSCSTGVSCTSDMAPTSEAAPQASAPQASAMKLASWTSEPPDKNTHHLFNHSSDKNTSQPSKRKLPDWAEVPRGPVTSNATNKAKKKKGLFS